MVSTMAIKQQMKIQHAAVIHHLLHTNSHTPPIVPQSEGQWFYRKEWTHADELRALFQCLNAAVQEMMRQTAAFISLRD